jgi:hypothetical protein
MLSWMLENFLNEADYQRYRRRRDQQARYRERYAKERDAAKRETGYTTVYRRRDGRTTDRRGNEYVYSSPDDDGYYHAMEQGPGGWADHKSGAMRLHRVDGRLVFGRLEFEYVGDSKYRLTHYRK